VTHAVRRVTLIPGDGVGAEVADAVVRIFAAASVPVEWERVEAGTEAMKRHGTPLPDEAVASIRRNGVARFLICSRNCGSPPSPSSR